MPVTLKRKASEADMPSRPPATAIPSTLPPSVEEAYRRKCIQLKNRTNEVEDANDAARLRLARIKRQVEKLRIERAFLLEQLSKRTSTNVEDSDGSPSPPPTPKDKPLRTKRGHRKSMAVDVDSKAPAGASFNTNAAQSPTSEGASQARANGKTKSAKKPASAFDLFCDENRSALEAKKKDDEDEEAEGDAELNVDDELTRLWKELPDAEREEFQAKFEKTASKEDEEEEDDEDDEDDKKDESKKDDKDEKASQEETADKSKSQDTDKPQTQDEDVEMGNYDTEDQDTQAEKAEE